MLYKNTEDALCQLLKKSEQRTGKVRLIVDLNTGAVDAQFYARIDQNQELYLHPSEYLVSTYLHPAGEAGVAIRCAATNAIDALKEVVNVDKMAADRQHLYATMTRPSGEVVPYDESVMSFLHEDFYINDPTLSQCGRFTVDPIEAYGFTSSTDENGDPCLSRPLHAGLMRLTGADGKGLPEPGSESNTLIRLDAEGHIMASASMSQIPTGDDYPDDIIELSRNAQLDPGAKVERLTTEAEVCIANAGGMDDLSIRNAFFQLFDEGVFQSHCNQEAGRKGGQHDLMKMDVGFDVTVENDGDRKLMRITVSHRSGLSKSDVNAAIAQALQDGRLRLKNAPEAGHVKEARQLRFSLGEQPIDLPAPHADYLIHGLTEADTNNTVERSINLVINEGLLVATELEDANGHPMEGPAGVAMNLDIGSPVCFHRAAGASVGHLSIPLQGDNRLSGDEHLEALEWVMQQGEARVRAMDSGSPEVDLIKRTTLALEQGHLDEPSQVGPNL